MRITTTKTHFVRTNFLTISIATLGILSLLIIGCSKEDSDLLTKEEPEPEPEPVSITMEDAVLTIAENPNIGFDLLTMNASTTGDDEIVFTISSQNPEGAMSIEGTAGEISVLDSAKFDYELNSELTAQVTATSEEASASADVKVILTDIDETVAAPAKIWGQIGETIDGEAASDQFGLSTSLSADGSILAVGGPFNDGNGSNSGHARVYRNNGGSWSQIGSDIDGEAAGDLAGWAVSLSDGGTILAVAARINGGVGVNAGHVRVYENIGDAWVQIGDDIDAASDKDNFGQSVNLSGDGTRIAVGANIYAGVGTKRGHVRVYENISGSWNQIGADIDGEANFDESGWSVSLNLNGSIVAIGAIRNDGNGQDSGHVRVFRNESDSWVQIGVDIDGEAAKNRSGYAVSLSDDGTIIAIGAPLYSTQSHEGHVRVFENVSDTWTQIGDGIDGLTAGSQAGYALSINGDGSSVAIGSYGYANTTGQVRVFKNESGHWNQVGENIDGTSEPQYFGISTSLSADGKIVAAGSLIGNSTSGNVRVYKVNE